MDFPANDKHFTEMLLEFFQRLMFRDSARTLKTSLKSSLFILYLDELLLASKLFLH